MATMTIVKASKQICDLLSPKPHDLSWTTSERILQLRTSSSISRSLYRGGRVIHLFCQVSKTLKKMIRNSKFQKTWVCKTMTWLTSQWRIWLMDYVIKQSQLHMLTLPWHSNILTISKLILELLNWSKLKLELMVHINCRKMKISREIPIKIGHREPVILTQMSIKWWMRRINIMKKIRSSSQ